MSRFLAILLLASSVAACDQDLTQTPTPDAAALATPQFTVVGPATNPYFAFLTPLSGGGARGGDFDPTLSPTVAVCAWNGTACIGDDVASFASGGSGGVKVTGRQYHVNWMTESSTLVAGTTYRLRVEVLGTELGHADVFAQDGKKKTTPPSGVYALQVGSTLPIRFHIGIGAIPPSAVIAVAGDLQAGGTTTFDGSGSVDRYDSPLTYAWDFGDGVHGGGAAIAHTYTVAGSYSARMVVTNGLGMSAAAASTVVIAGAPAPTGEARIVGKVRDTSGSPLSGVSVHLAGGAANATTNAAGSVVIEHVPAGVAAVLSLTKSGYVDQVVEVSVPAGSDGAVFERSMHKRGVAVTLTSAEAGGTVTGAAGASVTLPPAGLVNASGQPVSGAVSVSVTPIDVGNDIEAFPGSFTGVQSTGEEGTLMTYGVAEYVLTSGSQNLQLALGKTATIEIPIFRGGAAVGDAIPLWSLDERTGKWIAEGVGTVVSSSGSPSGLVLRGEVSHLSWWNADIFVSTPYSPHVTCTDASILISCSVRATVLDASFPGYDATTNLPAVGQSLMLPSDVTVRLIAISADGTLRGTITVNGPSGGNGNVDIPLTTTAASAATSTVSLSTATVSYNHTLTATLQARDADGNALTAGGDVVQFVAPGAGAPRAVLSMGPTVDNGDGTYSSTLTGIAVGTAVEVGAMVNGVPVVQPWPSVAVTLDGADPADIEVLIGRGYNAWFNGSYNYYGPGLFLSVQSFQHTSPWANAGMEYYGRIPRNAIENNTTNQYYGNFTRPWHYAYRAITAVSGGLGALEDPTVATVLGPTAVLRDRAYGYFVLGMAHATLAILYDQAFVVDETTGPGQLSLQPYDDVMTAAMGYFDQAISLSGQGSFTLPYGWMQDNVDNGRLARIAHSQKARYRAAVARTPAERQAVDWPSIIADIQSGITSDFTPFMDGLNGWTMEVIQYGSHPAWSQLPYWIYGMADQGVDYQTWLAQPILEKTPNPPGDTILIITADTRFPRGSRVADQRANPGLYFSSPFDIASVWVRPDRGTWRWSYYRETRWGSYHSTTVGNLEEISLDAMRLLEAEGRYRMADMAGAAALINPSRTAAGLAGTDAAGTNSDCVPRLPDGSCGGLWEMLKWEKRMQVQMEGLLGAPWFFDSRGWGDLWEGTPLQFPVPCATLQELGMGCYTFGGVGGPMAAPKSTYAYPGEG